MHLNVENKHSNITNVKSTEGIHNITLFFLFLQILYPYIIEQLYIINCRKQNPQIKNKPVFTLSIRVMIAYSMVYTQKFYN